MSTGHTSPPDNMNFLHGKNRLTVFSEISSENASEDDLSDYEMSELGIQKQMSSLLTSATSNYIMNTTPISAVLEEETKFEDCDLTQV
jgi:hypothetical protein